MARPSLYRDEFAAKARKLAVLGATDADLAAFFEVSIRTLERWKAEKDGFWQALELGKAEADNVVERRLFKRAIGYSHDAQKIMQYEGEPVIVDYVEHYPPDVSAAIFWLKNRRPDQWRERREIDLNATLTLQQLIIASMQPEALEPPTIDAIAADEPES